MDTNKCEANVMPLVGAGAHRYRPDADWAKRPANITWPEVAGVAVDREDNVYVFNRGDVPVVVFDREGNYLRSWGEGQFARPHGISIDAEGAVFCTDDLGHVVRKFTPAGELLMTLGVPSKPSATGATSIDYRTIRHAGPPFHFPTNVAFGPSGDLFISDGYGNARVHHFSADGQLIASWGEPGDGPGQFRVPHGIAVDLEGNVVVADRENSRLQVFSPSVKFLREICDIARPCQVAFDGEGNLYVAELGFRAGMWPGTVAPTPDATGGRISIFGPQGQFITRWGGGLHPTEPGDFYAPHDIAVDSHGDIYLAEVVASAGGNRGLVSPDCHALQKFHRVD